MAKYKFVLLPGGDYVDRDGIKYDPGDELESDERLDKKYAHRFQLVAGEDDDEEVTGSQWGELTTDRFEGAEEAGFEVYVKNGRYNAFQEGDRLNEKALGKKDMTEFIEGLLEG